MQKQSLASSYSAVSANSSELRLSPCSVSSTWLLPGWSFYVANRTCPGQIMSSSSEHSYLRGTYGRRIQCQCVPKEIYYRQSLVGSRQSFAGSRHSLVGSMQVSVMGLGLWILSDYNYSQSISAASDVNSSISFGFLFSAYALVTTLCAGCLGTLGAGDLVFLGMASFKLAFLCSVFVLFAVNSSFLGSLLICLVDLLFIILFYFLFCDLSLPSFSVLTTLDPTLSTCCIARPGYLLSVSQFLAVQAAQMCVTQSCSGFRMSFSAIRCRSS